jgi:hypothetical protein
MNTRVTVCLAVATLAGCAAPPVTPQPPPAPPLAVPAPPPAPPPPPVTIHVPVVEPADQAARHLLGYHDRLGQLGTVALAQELLRLGDGSASPQAAMELALLLGTTRNGGDLVRAQTLLDSVLREPSAQAWHGLARWLSQRYAEQRRAEEQAERLAQQLRETQRDNQRRLDQLNEKLEALKAIERSLTTRPAAPAASRASP